jgi:hypothetical protein
VMSGQSYLPEVFAALANSGLAYRWTFCGLTNAGENTQIFDRHIIPKWKPVLWYTKGKCDHLPWTGDIIEGDANDKRFHVWGQSEGQMERMVELASLPGQLILDPFCGGGTTGVATLRLGRRFIGLDIDESCIAQTAGRLEKTSVSSWTQFCLHRYSRHSSPASDAIVPDVKVLAPESWFGVSFFILPKPETPAPEPQDIARNTWRCNVEKIGNASGLLAGKNYPHW